MLNLTQASAAGKNRAKAREHLSIALERGLGPHVHIDKALASEKLENSKKTIDSFVKGDNLGELDSNPNPGEIQRQYSSRKEDVEFKEPDAHGAYSYSIVSVGEDAQGLDFTQTTLVDFDGKVLTQFERTVNSHGEGSNTLEVLSSLGGQWERREY